MESPKTKSLDLPILTYTMGERGKRGTFFTRYERIVIDIWAWMGITPTLSMNDPETVLKMRADAVKELADAKYRVGVLAARVQALDDVLALQNGSTASRTGSAVPIENGGALSLAGIGTTDAALAIINRYGNGKKIPSSEVRSLMVQHGYRYNGNVANFALSLYKVLIRLRKQKKIDGELQGKSWVFSAKIG